MKHLILIPVILILIACASGQNTGVTPPTNAEPISVIGVVPGVMKTTAPEQTKTPVPPTPTENPMANAPKGATGYDADRDTFYMEADDGYTYFYFNASTEQEPYWARPLIEDYYVYDTSDWNAIPMDVWVKYGTPGSESIVKMSHRDSTDIDDRSSTADHMNDFMMSRFSVDGVQLWSSLQEKNGLPFDFKFVGKTMSSSFGIDGGFTVTLVGEAELMPLFETNKAVRSSGTLGYVYLTYDGVEDGKVLVRVASSQPLEKLLKNVPGGGPENEFRQLIFLALMNILIADEGEDLINVAAMLDSSIVASDSDDLRADGKSDLQIVLPTDTIKTPSP